MTFLVINVVIYVFNNHNHIKAIICFLAKLLVKEEEDVAEVETK